MNYHVVTIFFLALGLVEIVTPQTVKLVVTRAVREIFFIANTGFSSAIGVGVIDSGGRGIMA